MGNPQANPTEAEPLDARAITRPEPVLLTYYTVVSALALVFFPFVFLPQYFKYKTLRYRFDDEGVSMAWGLLFRRETNLTYRRIQDIHLTRGLIQRWLGLATLGIQTASGSSSAEMEIVGITRAADLRDFLYERMRGAKGLNEAPPAEAGSEPSETDEALALLHEIRDELRAIRERAGNGP